MPSQCKTKTNVRLLTSQGTITKVVQAAAHLVSLENFGNATQLKHCLFKPVARLWWMSAKGSDCFVCAKV